MKHLQNVKFLTGLEPISLNGTAATATAMDSQGGSELLIVIQLGAIGAANFDSLSVTECETSGGSYTAITGAAFTAPTQTDDNKICTCHINLGGARKRYYKIVADPGAVATLVSCTGILGGMNQTPNSDTERGTLQSLFV